MSFIQYNVLIFFLSWNIESFSLEEYLVIVESMRIHICFKNDFGNTVWHCGHRKSGSFRFPSWTSDKLFSNLPRWLASIFWRHSLCFDSIYSRISCWILSSPNRHLPDLPSHRLNKDCAKTVNVVHCWSHSRVQVMDKILRIYFI